MMETTSGEEVHTPRRLSRQRNAR